MLPTKSVKRDLDNTIQTVSGYLHSVSPLKRSRKNNLYFNASMQCKDDLKGLVSYDTDKHEQFVKAEKMASPVKLSNVSIVPSRDGKGKDIEVNARTRLNVLESTDVGFKRRKLDTSISTTSVTKIQEIRHPSGMITIHVKVTGENQETIETIFGRLVPKKDFLVSDETGSIFLSAWDHQITMLKLNKTYKIQSVSSRIFDQLKLTTTQTTVTEPAKDLKDTSARFPDKQSNDITGVVKLVAVTLGHKCSSCKMPVTTDTLFTRCSSCKMKQLTSDLIKTSTLKINLQDNHNVHRFTVFQQTFHSFLEKENILDLLQDTDSLEEYLLGKTLKVSAYNNICHRMFAVSQSHTTGSTASSASASASSVPPPASPK